MIFNVHKFCFMKFEDVELQHNDKCRQNVVCSTQGSNVMLILNPSLPYLHICYHCTHCAHGLLKFLDAVLMDTSDLLCVVIMIRDEFHPYCETNAWRLR